MTTITNTPANASSIIKQLSGASSLQAGSGSSADATSAAGSASNFLQMLVAQMQNQDPLNPMDNAQVTSQMAQINTVSGINQLNTAVNSLGTQFTQMQALQGASLIGRNVLLSGNQLTLGSAGQAGAAFSLASAADAVKVQVRSPAGKVVDTIDVGASSAGQHPFTWTPPAGTSGSGYTFQVAATAGASPVSATPLMQDTVQAVSTSGGALTLQLRGGSSVPYSQISALE